MKNSKFLWPFTTPFKKNLNEDIALIQSLASLESRSYKKRHVQIQQRIIARYLANLGFETVLIPNPENCSADLLYAIYPGVVSEQITFVCHSDTVRPAVKPKLVKNDNGEEYLVGPGVADNKAGIVLGLSAIKNFITQHKKPYHTLAFLCSPNEEVGSTGWHEFMQDVGKKSKFVLGLEPATKEGHIISSRGGNWWLDIICEGKSGHSGRSGKNSQNANHLLMFFLNELNAINSKYKKSFMNINSIVNTTNEHNIICDKATAKIDIRFSSSAERKNVKKFVDELLHDFKSKLRSDESIKIITVDDCPVLSGSGESKFWENIYLKILGENKKAIHTQGAADSNYICNERCIVLDGLGPIAGKMHTQEEYFHIASFQDRKNKLALFLKEINYTLQGRYYDSTINSRDF